jgi:hypothetical protein
VSNLGWEEQTCWVWWRNINVVDLEFFFYFHHQLNRVWGQFWHQVVSGPFRLQLWGSNRGHAHVFYTDNISWLNCPKHKDKTLASQSRGLSSVDRDNTLYMSDVTGFKLRSSHLSTLWVKFIVTRLLKKKKQLANHDINEWSLDMTFEFSSSHSLFLFYP